AHELTHTIQQREVVQREMAAGPAPAEVSVSQYGAPQVQRGLISRALDWVAEKANNIPGFRLFTVVLGTNPINMSSVPRTGENLLRGMVEIIPGGGAVADALANHGILQRGGKFIEDQFRSLGMVGSAFRDALMEFLDSLGWSDIVRPHKVISRAIAIFTAPVKRLISFGTGLVVGIATLVKDAILKPLGAWASRNIPKWDLLIGVFGKNPISGESASPANAIIGGFMRLIGQEEIWNNIQKGGAIGKAWNWFQTAMKDALALVIGIPGEVVATLKSLTIMDIVTIVGAFGKIAKAFGGFVGRFLAWAGKTVLSLLEIILTVVAPRAVPYLKKAGGAFKSIIANPIGFVRTLVAAGKLGFQKFASNFLGHLQDSMIKWLTGAMGGTGIYLPKALNILEILKFALSVLGLTWANMRAKLVTATNETVVKALETGFDIVKTLVTDGPAAAWQQIVETLTNLKQMAIDAVMDFVKSRIVAIAVRKLLAFLSPAGAFIEAIIAIYNTVMFFVERIRQIAAVAASFIDSIAAIAAGNIAPAAARVEKTMAGLLVLVISFLARLAGLGKVSDAVNGLIQKIRDPINKALDKVVAWIVSQAKKLGKMAFSAGKAALAAVTSWWKARRSFSDRSGQPHSLYFAGEGKAARLTVATIPTPVVGWLANVASAVAASADPSVKAAYAGAHALLSGGLATRLARLNSGGASAPAPSAVDVDALNADLAALSLHLSVLMPLDPRATAAGAGAAGPAKVGVNALIKLKRENSVALVVAIGPLKSGPEIFVHYKRLRPRGKPFLAEATNVVNFNKDWGSQFTAWVDDPREFYMGPTPSRRNSAGKTVVASIKARMQAQGRYDPSRQVVLYNRSGTGAPLPVSAPLNEYPESKADLGHLVDAVHYWNSNGRLTFPQSPQVLQFMNDPNNYELEPSKPNQLRGAQLSASGVRYLPPVA
ncbi:hypothetical protein, partial [Sandarakinorhabdus sp.]|uniref:phage tail protein n=1 Tax=Sandarakinorhabdus sp. TaxID=1916663 RepID=UPI00286E93A4